MKKFYAFAASVAMSAMSLMAQAQSYTVLEDMTSKIVNADFKADAPVTSTVCTYDYDMEGNATTLYGQQAVTGWVAAAQSDNTLVSTGRTDAEARKDGLNARAGGIFAFYDESKGGDVAFGLGSSTTYPPTILDDHKGPALGMVAVWSSDIKYSQEITLPAGAYAFVVSTCNTLGGDPITNYNGFVAEDGTQYLSKTTTYEPNETLWQDDVTMFILDKETKGTINIGYKAGNFGSAKAPHLFIEGVKLYRIDPAPLIKEKVDARKEALLELIEAGLEVGADTDAAQRVYDNDNATMDEVNEAIDNQIKINKAAVTDLSDFFITNPHFTMDDAVEGGITTYDYDRSKNSVEYYGMQPVKGWNANRPAASLADNPVDKNTGVNNGQASGVYEIGSGAFLGGTAYTVPGEMSDGSKEGKVLGFVACWSSVAQYTQHVTIPAGEYTLTISYYNINGTLPIKKNLMGFVADDGTEYLSDKTSFEIGAWKKMTVKFTLDEGTSGNFSLGYAADNKGSGEMPKFFIDGISLNYVGEADFDPSIFALKATVEEGNTLLESDFYDKLKEEFESVVSAGDALVKSQSADADKNKQAADAINAMIDVINANIRAYETLSTFADETLADAMEKYADVPALYDRLVELNDEITMEVLQEYTWSTEQINATIDSLDVMIKEEVEKLWKATAAAGTELDKDLDITILLDGLSYTYSTTAQQGTNVPDKEWAYGDATNFKTQFATAEVWNQSPFKVVRTLENMPAGTYTVTTRGFYRTAENSINYENYQADQTDYAFVFAGHNRTGLANQAQLAAPTNEMFGTEVSGVYMPNSQADAEKAFKSEEYAGIVEKSVKTVLTKDGNLDLGVCAKKMEGNSWVVWYSFQVAYNAIDESVMEEELECFKDEVLDYIDSNEDYLTTPVMNAALKATDGNDLAAIAEAYDNLQENFAAVAALQKAGEDLMGVEAYYETASVSIQKAYDAFFEKLDSFEKLTTEQVNALIQDAKDIMDVIRIPGESEKASDDNPVDMTQVIVNPDFEQNAAKEQAKGWTLVKGEGASGNYQIQTGFEGVSMEFWSNTTGEGTKFNFYQRLAKLPAGTYEITADMANSLNGQQPGEGTGAIYLYAAAATGDNLRYASSEPVSVQSESLNGDDKVWKNYSVTITIEEGQDLVIGAMNVDVLSARWAMVDNFKLTYYGKASSKSDSPADPVIIEDVETVASAASIYSVSGTRVSALSKGVNIVKMTDGTVKKVLVK